MKKNRKIEVILTVYIVSICLMCLINFKIDPDYLWHLKAGEYMFKNGILRHDIFSWSVHGRYWMSHEWLFEILIYFLKIVFGKAHIFIYCFSTTLILIFIMFFTNKRNIMKNLTFSIFWFALFILCMFYVQARPHMISFIFLSLTIYFLYDLYKNESSKKIYFLPLISILWANIHGGSSNLPYLFCFIFIISGLFDFKFSKIRFKKLNKIQLKKYLIVMILCMIAVCINIHGLKMFIYPYQNMMDKKMIENIIEWRSTSLNELSNYIYILFVVFITMVMLLSKRKMEFIDFILFGFSVFLGLKSIRFWFYTYIIMSYCIYNYIGRYEDDIKILKIGVSCFVILFVTIFSINVHKFFPKHYYFLLESKDIEYIKSLNSQKLFNTYNYGGDLIYNDIPVFIDGRADLYSKDIFGDYLSISNSDGDYYVMMRKYDFDYYLVEGGSNIDYYLTYSGDKYMLLYSNKNVRIYKKK